VFQYLDDLVMYSVAIPKHQLYLTEILGKLHSTGFTLDKQIVLGANDIKYLGHYLSSTGTGDCPVYEELPSSAQFAQCAAFCWKG
jgi:hypothetical protein